MVPTTGARNIAWYIAGNPTNTLAQNPYTQAGSHVFTFFLVILHDVLHLRDQRLHAIQLAQRGVRLEEVSRDCLTAILKRAMGLIGISFQT